jgi:hypothetical protein
MQREIRPIIFSRNRRYIDTAQVTRGIVCADKRYRVLSSDDDLRSRLARSLYRGTCRLRTT